MSVNVSKWSKSVSKCKTVSESDYTCQSVSGQRVSVSISVLVSSLSVSVSFFSLEISEIV